MTPASIPLPARARLGLASALALGMLGAPVQANPFSAQYTVQVSVDASKAAPQSATDRAMIKAAAAMGTFELGSVSDSGFVRGNDLRLRSIGTGNKVIRTFVSDDRLEIIRTSEAQWVKGSLVTTRYTDRRGSSPLLTYTADIGKGRYEFRRGTQVTGGDRLRFSNVDTAALPYLFLGRPLPAAPFSLAYTDAKSVKVVTFRPTQESLTVAGQPVATVRITSVQKAATDPLIDIWLRRDDGFPLRIRLGLSAQYGAVADQQIRTLPPLYKPGG